MYDGVYLSTQEILGLTPVASPVIMNI